MLKPGKRGKDLRKRRRRFTRSLSSKAQKTISKVRNRTAKLGLRGAGQAVKGDIQRKTARTNKGKAIGIKNSVVGRAKAAPTVLAERARRKVNDATSRS